MNKIALGLLILTVMAAGAAGGWVARDRFETLVTGNQSGFTTPTPTPAADETVASEDGKVAAYDGRTLTVKLDNGEEISFGDLSNAGVWTVASVVGADEKPAQSNWEVVKTGKRITVSFDKTSKELLGVLVYTE